MAKGLNCLIKNLAFIQKLKDAMIDIADAEIKLDKNAKITAQQIFKQFKDAGIDIDLQSVASIYSDAFASKVDTYTNYETTDELQKYANKLSILSKEVKEKLIELGFGKEKKDGKYILDWRKLMRLSEKDLTDKVKEATKKNMNGSTTAEIDFQTAVNIDVLKNNWKEIISNAIIKGQNELRRKDEKVTAKEKIGIDKVADLWAYGQFDTLKDSYQNALRKAVGIDGTNLVAMSELDKLGSLINQIQNTPYGSSNSLGLQVQAQINRTVSLAQFQNANGFFKIATGLKVLVDMAMLKLLNNLGNRVENLFSGKSERYATRMQYGKVEADIKELQELVKSDIIRNGASDFTSNSDSIYSDRNSSDKVREKLTSNNRIGNWAFNQLMGTASLNGVDSYFKVGNTWQRFVSNMSHILASDTKKMTEQIDNKIINEKNPKKLQEYEDLKNQIAKNPKEVADKLLHEEIFGSGKWEKARLKAKATIDKINLTAAVKLNATDESIGRFAADIIKFELINNGVIASDHLDTAWKVGEENAGRGMGHVPNNQFSLQISLLRQKTGEAIKKATKEQNYSKAAGLVITDIFVNKIALKFLGGSTNWLVLKASKSGLGIIGGGVSKLRNSKTIDRLKTISEFTNEEIEETLRDFQRTQDTVYRGTFGLMGNAALTAMFFGALKIISEYKGTDEEEEKKKYLLWLRKNKYLDKMLNKTGTLFVNSYIAYSKQEQLGFGKEAWNPMSYKEQPLKDFALNQFGQNPDFSFVNQISKAAYVFSDDKDTKMKGFGSLGEISSRFDLNPLPTNLIYGAYKIGKEIANGGTINYEEQKFDSKAAAYLNGILKGGAFQNMAFVRKEDIGKWDADEMKKINGVSDKKIEHLKKANISKLETFSKLSEDEIAKLKYEDIDVKQLLQKAGNSDKEKYTKNIFSKREAQSIYNQINGFDKGKYSAKSLGITDSEIKELKSIGYVGFDEKNIDRAISQTKKNLNELNQKDYTNGKNIDDYKNKIEYENIVKELDKLKNKILKSN